MDGFGEPRELHHYSPKPRTNNSLIFKKRLSLSNYNITPRDQEQTILWTLRDFCYRCNSFLRSGHCTEHYLIITREMLISYPSQCWGTFKWQKHHRINISLPMMRYRLMRIGFFIPSELEISLAFGKSLGHKRCIVFCILHCWHIDAIPFFWIISLLVCLYIQWTTLH